MRSAPKTFTLPIMNQGRVLSIVILAALGLSLVALQVPAQTESASLINRFRNLEGEYKRLNAAVEDLMATQTAQAKRLSDVVSQLRAAEKERVQESQKYATKEDIRRLEKAINELNRERQEDKTKILAAIKELRNSQSAPVPQPDVSSPQSPANPRQSPEFNEGYEYTIQQGNTLSAIVRAYQKQGVDVTLQMVLDANPDIEPTKIQPGQKIFIPDPSK